MNLLLLFHGASHFAEYLPLEESAVALRQRPASPPLARWGYGEELPRAAAPATNLLLSLGGADLRDDYFFLDNERYADIAWELGDGYGQRVSFRAFERRIEDESRRQRKRGEFREVMAAFGEETAERQKLAVRIVTIAGVTYIVWRILAWL